MNGNKIIPTWGLVVMFAAGVVGLYFLGEVLLYRFK